MNKTALAIGTVLSGAMLLNIATPLWFVATCPIWGFIAAGVADQLIEQAKKLLTLSK